MKLVISVNLSRFLNLCAHIQMLPFLKSGEETLVGGQAVMEGVMMRAPHSYCVACASRRVKSSPRNSPFARMSEKYPLFKLPILRGIGTLGQAMTLGTRRSIFRRTRRSMTETDEAGADVRHADGRDCVSGRVDVVVFKFVPLFLADSFGACVPALHGRLAINVMRRPDSHGDFLVYMYALSLSRISGGCSSFTGRSTKWCSTLNRAIR